jgi:hypothetical protein
MMETPLSNQVTAPSREKVRASLFVDCHMLQEVLEYLRIHIASLPGKADQERQVRYFVVLHETLAEMLGKLQKHRSVRLDYW